MKNLNNREINHVIDGLFNFLTAEDVSPAYAKRQLHDAMFTVIDAMTQEELDNIPSYLTASKVIKDRFKKDGSILDKYWRFI